MAYVVFQDGVTTVTIRYVEAKPNGSYQYRRRIPSNLQEHYSGRRFFVRSLKRDRGRLAEHASRITARLDAEWHALRLSKGDASEARRDDDIGSDRNRPEPYFVPARAFRVEQSLPPRPTILLRQALELYLAHHPKGDRKSFRADPERLVALVTKLVGNLPIEAYNRQHAEEVRDHLLSKNTTGSARRRLNTIAAIFNKARKEKQLPIANPFEALGIPNEHKDAVRRQPFTVDELKLIATACRSRDDDIRHIVALQLDTGARLAEIVGLRVLDVILEPEVPHLLIRPFGAVRTLKTPASERSIPLVGEALWAARMALEAHRKLQGGNDWLFARYAADNEIKATHASNTLNKWLRSIDGVEPSKTTHSFRHSMRDRLRAAMVPHDIQEAIGGWGSRSVGQGYGKGYPLDVIQQQLFKVTM